jgi:hypothetical protein
LIELPFAVSKKAPKALPKKSTTHPKEYGLIMRLPHNHPV